MFMDKPLEMEVKGRDMISGLPKTIIIKSDDTTEALQHDLEGLIDAIKQVLHDTPPELSADVMDKGIVMSGGSSQLRNLDELVAQATGVACHVADEPLLCVAKGTGIALENLESYKRSIMSTK
jgi:rod shape-determining protein MreB